MEDEKKKKSSSPIPRKRPNPSPTPTSSPRLNRRAAIINAVAAINQSSAKQVSPESTWKSKRQSILDTLEKLQTKPDEKEKVISPRDETLPQQDKTMDQVPKRREGSGLEKSIRPSSEKPQEISSDMKMNVQLMNGELPQYYVDLLTRFTVVDLFLKKNYPRMTLLSNIHNYLVLSDYHMSFMENHVKEIVYLYGYQEEEDRKRTCYGMGRTVPKLYTEKSALMLRLPTMNEPESSESRLVNILTSTRNLNGVFSSMNSGEKMKVDFLQERTAQLKRHMNAYITERYEMYLTRSGSKKPEVGRAAGFTMTELGAIPEGEIPAPIPYQKNSFASFIAQAKKDVKKEAKKENPIASEPSTPQRKQKKIYRKFDMDLRLM